MKLKYRILHPILDTIGYRPQYKTDGSAAFDLVATSTHLIEHGQSALVGTGLAIHIDDTNVCGELQIRSGFSHNLTLSMTNGEGLIDSDYQGELMVSIVNTGTEDRKISIGDRFAQLSLKPVIRVAEFERVEAFDAPTGRGEGGFGSTKGFPLDTETILKLCPYAPQFAEFKLSDDQIATTVIVELYDKTLVTATTSDFARDRAHREYCALYNLYETISRGIQEGVIEVPKIDPDHWIKNR